MLNKIKALILFVVFSCNFLKINSMKKSIKMINFEEVLTASQLTLEQNKKKEIKKFPDFGEAAQIKKESVALNQYANFSEQFKKFLHKKVLLITNKKNCLGYFYFGINNNKFIFFPIALSEVESDAANLSQKQFACNFNIQNIHIQNAKSIEINNEFNNNQTLESKQKNKAEVTEPSCYEFSINVKIVSAIILSALIYYCFKKIDFEKCKSKKIYNAFFAKFFSSAMQKN